MHLVTFDDPATPCRVTATLSTSGMPAGFVVDLDIVGGTGAERRSCRDRLGVVVDDHDIVAAITSGLPDVVDVLLTWAELRARVELVTLTGAVFDVVDGDRWQCTVGVRWSRGSATVRAGVPDRWLGDANAIGDDRGLCDVWTVGDHVDAWLTSSSPFIHCERVLSNVRTGALRQRAVWLAMHAGGLDVVAGTFTADDLRRLTWPIAWSASTPPTTRRQHEHRLATLKACGLDALAADVDAVAVVVEAGVVVGTVRAMTP